MEITLNKALKLKNKIFVDVRSPVEFEQDHIPNAINLSLFNNEERKQVGIMFKQNKKKAVDLGIEFYSKKLPNLVKVISTLDKEKTIVVYCWRGGMRSKAITQLFDLLGYKVFQLSNGYKCYRSYVIKELNDIPKLKLVVLYGLAGCGKTELIRKLPNSLDLEGLAQHRSSVFGSIGLKPNTQKMFDSLLLDRIKHLDKKEVVFVEGESRKIGNVSIPDYLFGMMKKAVNVKIMRSMNERVKQIVKDYFNGDDEEIKNNIIFLKKRLGRKITENLIDLMNKKQYRKVSEILLRNYYDGLYKNTVDNVNYSLEANNDYDCTDKLINFCFF